MFVDACKRYWVRMSVNIHSVVVGREILNKLTTGVFIFFSRKQYFSPVYKSESLRRNTKT